MTPPLDAEDVPGHVGLIPDGARRWAAKAGVSLEESYRETFQRLARHTSDLYEYGASAVSLYLLSRRNLQRRPTEIAALIGEEVSFCRRLQSSPEFRDVAVKVAGDLNLVPPELASSAVELAARPSPGLTRRLYLCIAYDPFDEIAQAMAASPGARLASFWVPEEVDLLVRTSGVRSLSDFLPVQCAYAQLRFLPMLFNDMTGADLQSVLRDYASSERRRGR